MKAMVKMSKVMTKRCYITILNLYLCLYSRTSFPPEIHEYTPLAKTVWDFLSESIYFTQKGDVLASYELQKQVHKHFNQPPIHHMISFCNSLPSVSSFEKKRGGLFSEVVLHHCGLSVCSLASGPTRNQAKPRKRKHWSPP